MVQIPANIEMKIEEKTVVEQLDLDSHILYAVNASRRIAHPGLLENEEIWMNFGKPLQGPAGTEYDYVGRTSVGEMFAIAQDNAVTAVYAISKIRTTNSR